MLPKQILMIGSDLHTNGGIASVVKCYHKAYSRNKDAYNLNFTLLRTYYYKDKGPLAELFILVKAIFQCIWYLSSRRIDVVHIHSSAGVSFARKTIFVYICKAFGKKTILHLHASRFYDFFLPQGGLKKKWINTVFKKVDLVIALCSDWETHIRAHYPEVNVRTIHNPVDLQQMEFTPKIKQERDFRVIFVGFLIESKGIKDLLNLARQLKDQGKTHIKFILAGKGELENYILDYVARHELEQQVNYIGWVSGDTKDQLYRDADLFFLPSYKEGMPMSILEAMSYSLPVVSTNIAGIPDLIDNGKNGFMLKPGDIEGFNQKISQLAASPEMLAQFREQSYKKVSDFDTEKILKQIEDVYQQITGASSHSNEPPVQANP